jgi:hypothetical protein
VQALSIVSWNMEHLMDQRQFEAWRSMCERAGWKDSAAPRGSGDPLPPCYAHSGETPWGEKTSKPLRQWQDYRLKLLALRERAQQLNADVYLLQEVAGADAVRAVIDGQKYDVFVAGSGGLALAMAVRKGVQLIERPSAYDALAKTVTLDGAQRTLRPGQQAAFNVRGHRVDVLNLHLKSGCRNDVIDRPDVQRRKQEGARRKREDCAALRVQVPELEAWIEQRQKSGTAFMVAGDFNRSLWAERADRKPARCDTSAAASVLGQACLANILPELDDTPTSRLLLAETRVKAFANGAMCAVRQRKSDGESLCHCGIDNFLVSESLLQKLGLQIQALQASGAHYGMQHYGVDKVRPSDHCPLQINL